MIKFFFIFLLFFSTNLLANDYGFQQINPPNSNSVIEYIHIHIYDVIGGYRVDFYCHDNTHYIYVSPIGCEYTEYLDKKLYESLGKKFSQIQFLYFYFNNYNSKQMMCL